MAVKHSIVPRSIVDIRFSASASNTVPATLSSGFSIPASSPIASARVAPGESGEIRISAGGDGVLRIHVDLRGRRGAGRLEVRADGMIVEDDEIEGDTWWFHMVREDEGAAHGVHGGDRIGK
jgi:hypothetical protein